VTKRDQETVIKRIQEFQAALAKKQRDLIAKHHSETDEFLKT